MSEQTNQPNSIPVPPINEVPEHIRTALEKQAKEEGFPFPIYQDEQQATTPPVKRQQPLPPQQQESQLPFVQPGRNTSAVSELVSRLNKQREIYQPFDLPSRGMFNPEVKNGQIYIRAMGGKEERILLTQRLMRSGDALNMIFAGCVRGVNPLELTSPDRLWLMYVIRSLTYGTLYEYETKCPSCDQIAKESQDLDQLPVNYVSEEVTDPVTYELPDSGLVVSYSVERGRHEAELRKKSQMKKRNFFDQGEQPDEVFDIRATMIITRFEDPTTGQIFDNSTDIHAIWTALSAADRTSFRNAINNQSWGISTDIMITCPYCQYEYEIPLPVGVDFFYPRKIQKKSSSTKLNS